MELLVLILIAVGWFFWNKKQKENKGLTLYHENKQQINECIGRLGVFHNLVLSEVINEFGQAKEWTKPLRHNVLGYLLNSAITAYDEYKIPDELREPLEIQILHNFGFPENISIDILSALKQPPLVCMDTKNILDPTHGMGSKAVSEWLNGDQNKVMPQIRDVIRKWQEMDAISKQLYEATLYRHHKV